MKKSKFKIQNLSLVTLMTLFSFRSCFGITYGSLFTESRASRVGDLVTVLISESSYGTNRAETRVDKDDNVSIQAAHQNLLPSTIGGIPIGNSLSGGLSTRNDHAGRARSIHEGKLVAYVTATVVEVMDNGNLRIKGEKKIHLNQDDQIIKVFGIVRPQDIMEGNVVSSVCLADAKIEYKGKGVVDSGHRKSFIFRIIDWIF